MVIVACVPQQPQEQKTAETRETPATTDNQQVTPPAQPPKEDKGFTGKLKNALKLNTPLKCTWKNNEENSLVYYVAGKKVRMEATSPEGLVTYVVATETCSYTWEKETNEGLEMCFAPGTTQSQDTQADETTGGYQGDVDCTATAVSDSMFAKPSGVKFTNAQDLLNQIS